MKPWPVASDLNAIRRARARRLCGLALLTGLAAGCTTVAPEALQPFEATLAARDSATAALEAWCARNQLGKPPEVTAAVLNVPVPREPADARRLLRLSPQTRLAYRHVQLACGGTTLSMAHNWYVPERLTPAMNQALETSRVPFGKVAAPLRYRRERLDRLPRGSRECPAGTILGHRAMLRLPDGQPLALLVECYTRANLQR